MQSCYFCWPQKFENKRRTFPGRLSYDLVVDAVFSLLLFSSNAFHMFCFDIQSLCKFRFRFSMFSSSSCLNNGHTRSIDLLSVWTPFLFSFSQKSSQLGSAFLSQCTSQTIVGVYRRCGLVHP